MNSVAVAVPIYRPYLTPDENFSAKCLGHHLNSFDIRSFGPAGCKGQLPYPHIDFPATCFESIDTYSELMLTRRFYETFSSYDFVLIYQLDCLVFSNSLAYFCSLGFDYIGAPWVRAVNDQPVALESAGNGGLSLRRIDAFLDVLNSPIRITSPLVRLRQGIRKQGWLDRIMAVPAAVSKLSRYRNDVDTFLKAFLNHQGRWSCNEDRFWALKAQHFKSDFRVADPMTSLAFSIEQYPEFCVEQNGGQLPFGCHAWNRYGRNFWQNLAEFNIEHA